MNKDILFKYNDVGSTNVYARTLLENNNLPEETVIWAAKQTEGKGLDNKRWYSVEGQGLTFSIIFYPGFLELDCQFTISMAVSLGIVDSFKKYFYDVKIKWPNDIYIDNKKMGGILIENTIFSNKIKYCIIGIGLNVNGTEFPGDIPNPVSMQMISGRTFDLEKIIEGVVDSIKARYEELKAGAYNAIKAAYLDYLIGYKDNRRYKSKGHVFNAEITDVEMHGPIVLKTNDGNRFKYFFKEVEMLKKVS